MQSIFTGEWSRGGTMPEIPDDESWAVTEFADAELGEARCTQRLVELATVLAQRPSTSLPEACGIQAMLKAAYHFFDNAAIDPPEILASHMVATSNRLAGVPWVLAVQDITELDWTAHSATCRLGPLAHPAHQRLLVHTTLALTPERLHSPVGARGMASALLRYSCDRHSTGDTAPLRQAVCWIGCLGGFLARHGDGEPASRCCGKAFSISRISRPCTGSCALLPRNQKMWVKTSPKGEG
jgi:Transposase DNA-binding